MRTDVNKKIEEIQEDLESDEFLTVRNPKNKRIVHIIKEEKIENPVVNIGEDTIYSSVCKNYRISGTGEIRLNKRFKKMASVKTKTQIENSNEICGNCINRL